MFQKALFDRIAHRLPPEASLIEDVATTLDISYDAAHRRTSLKSKLSLDESVLLARRYHIAMDGLFEVASPHIVSVQKTEAVHDEASASKVSGTVTPFISAGITSTRCNAVVFSQGYSLVLSFEG